MYIHTHLMSETLMEVYGCSTFGKNFKTNVYNYSCTRMINVSRKEKNLKTGHILNIVQLVVGKTTRVSRKT